MKPDIELADMSIIEARNAVEGETYLHSTMLHTIKIIRKHGNPDIGYVSSVLVESETEPLRQIAIAGGTELISYNEKLRKPVLRRYPTTTNQEDAVMKKKQTTQRGTPRSAIIDKELLRYSGKAPDCDAIATAVVKAGAAKESEKKNIVAQIRARASWYKRGLKKNPALSKPDSKKS